jgi:hypothetical protein
MPSLELPERTSQAEDEFVEAWSASDDLEALVEVTTHAMDARRPRLAARLVQLLPDRVEIEPGSALEKAQRVAGMLVMDSRDVELFNALDDAWREVRRSRMRRMIARQKTVGTNRQYTIPRVGRKRRR